MSKYFQPSLEATLDRNAEEAGRELEEEEEYVRLQFERNSLVRRDPNASARKKEQLKNLTADGDGGDDREALLDSLLEDVQSQLQLQDGEEPASNPDNSGEEEYLMLCQEKERLLKKTPVASQRTKEQKAELKKIYNRLGKIATRRTDLWKRKAVAIETGFNSEEQREGQGLLSAQNGRNENQHDGCKMKR